MTRELISAQVLGTVKSSSGVPARFEGQLGGTTLPWDALRTGRIDRLSGNLCKSEDFEAARERFVTFMAGGFDALYKRRKAGSG